MVAPRSRPATRAIDIAGVEFDRGAHLLQPLEVQVDRPRADGAAAGQRDPRLPHPRQQRPEHQDGGAHLAHDVVRRLGIGDRAAERERAAVIAGTVHRDAVLGQQLRHRLDIGEPRHVGQHQPLLGQQPGGHQRQRWRSWRRRWEFRQTAAGRRRSGCYPCTRSNLLQAGAARRRAGPCICPPCRRS